MKTALITTTINVPTVLELYRQHGPDVRFFIAGDLKTPQAAADWCHDIPGTTYLSPEMQKSFDYKCSELIGWNSIQRRNIALLEAVKWGADIIVSTDDDNIPLNANYFKDFNAALNPNRFSGYGAGFDGQFRTAGIKVSGLNGWFDVGQLLQPVSPHRGYPLSHRADLWRADHVVGAKVGVAAGICLGDPDINATTRIEKQPAVHQVSELLQSGIVVDNKTWTVFNSQNTAFIRELAPAFFMLPGVGRYDDIYASLIMQRVMRERGLHVHFGKPFAYQQRNAHNLVRDLRGEIDGMENIERFAQWLDGRHLVNKGPLRQTWKIWEQSPMKDWMPQQTIDAALAFLDDMEGVL